MPIVVIQPHPPGSVPPPEAVEGMRRCIDEVTKYPERIAALDLGSYYTFVVVDSDTPFVVEGDNLDE